MTASELVTWREKMGWTQTDLAETLGVHIVTLARWETNASPIPPFLHLALERLEQKMPTKPKRAGKKPGRPRLAFKRRSK